jgi:catechol 2,3-dioxygenase-like lactoylglutathione lyase family enzyme
MTPPRTLPRPALVPELNITALPASLAFWRDLLGFRVLYGRPEQGFAAIEREGIEFMLEEYETGPTERSWDTGPREKPYGRGINFEMTVSEIAPLLERLKRAAWPVFFGPEERWYRIGASEETGVRQFLVQDPDGYLLRLSQSLGRRPLQA